MRRVLFHAKSEFYHNGIPVAGGTVKFLETGTQTLKNTYSDYSLATPNANPVVLNAQGRASVFLEDGFYDVEVYDANGVLLYTEQSLTDDTSVAAAGPSATTATLMCNGHFETADPGDPTVPEDWTIATFAGGSFLYDSTDRQTGAKSIKFTSTGTGGGTATSCFFPVNDEVDLQLLWNLKSSVAGVENQVDFLWYDAAQVQLPGGSASTNIYSSTANPTDWTAKNDQVTPPTGAFYGRVQLIGAKDTTGTPGSTWYDGLVLNYTTAQAGAPITFDSLFQIGDLKPSLNATPATGWLNCDGATLGDTGSGATYTGAAYQALFDIVKLMTPNAGTEVWGTNTVVIPDLRGRVFAGLDNMGTPKGNASRLSTMVGEDVLGGTFGTQTHTLTVAQMPTHSHKVNLESFAITSGSHRAAWSSGAAGQETTFADGGGQAHPNVQPTFVGHWHIKYTETTNTINP